MKTPADRSRNRRGWLTALAAGALVVSTAGALVVILGLSGGDRNDGGSAHGLEPRSADAVCADTAAFVGDYGKDALLGRSGLVTVKALIAWREAAYGTSQIPSKTQLTSMDPTAELAVCIYYGAFGPAMGPPLPDGATRPDYDTLQVTRLPDGTPILTGLGYKASVVDKLPSDPPPSSLPISSADQSSS